MDKNDSDTGVPVPSRIEKRISNYAVLSSVSVDELEKTVHELLIEKDGWRPSGGVAVAVIDQPHEFAKVPARVIFYQAMIRVDTWYWYDDPISVGRKEEAYVPSIEREDVFPAEY